MVEKTQQKPVAEHAPEKKRHYSIGERLFDFSVYGLMNWVGTFVITVPVAWLLQYWKPIRPTFEAAEAGLQKGMPWVLRKIDWVLSPIRKVPSAAKMDARAKDWANTILMTTTTMQGGNIMLIPIKWAEKRKIGFVNSVNHMFGDKADASDIKEAPQQTWGTLIKSRLSAFGMVFITFTAAAAAVPNTFRAFSEEFGHKFAKWFRSTPFDAKLDPKLLEERAVLRIKSGDSVAARLKEVESIIEKHETKAFQMGKIASWDTIATTAAVILLYVGSRFFAKKEEQKHDKKSEPSVQSTAPVVSSNTDTTQQPKVEQRPEKPRVEVMARSVSADAALQSPSVTVSV